MNREKVILHDSDPKHQANILKNELNKQPFDVLEWPVQSSDLNPI